MNLIDLRYHWCRAVATIFSQWSKPQTGMLATFSLGVCLARSCTLARVAEKLFWVGKADTVERRLQRFLGNEALDWKVGCHNLARWVLSSLALDLNRIVLLVDETALKDNLKIMVVALAYHGRAIPLAWWCYPPERYPMGQVKLIDTLLGWVAAAVPVGCQVLVQADRGIGTSPSLLRRIERRGWFYLVRVQASVRLELPDGSTVTFGQVIEKPGQEWCGWVQAFKKAGWMTCRAMAYWGWGHKEPWLLLTNHPQARSALYGWRMWEELAFRDLKSGGWNWQKSHVWDPDHANRLLLVLALAYAWILSLGTQGNLIWQVREQISRGTQRRHSYLALGLRVLSRIGDLFQELLCCCDLLFIPSIPDLKKSVV